MTSARTDILDRVRKALAQAYLPGATAATPPPPAAPDFGEPLSQVFARAVEAVQGQVHRVPNDAAARDFLLAEFETRGADRILCWEPHALPIPGLANDLQAQGITLVPGRLPGPDRLADLVAPAAVEVGLTGAMAGLADTGSIVLFADRDHGRLASLLPAVHFAVLPASRIYPDLAAWIAAPAVAERIARSSSTLIITGPSRTADIAQTLTLGAHGPKELHVVLVGA